MKPIKERIELLIIAIEIGDALPEKLMTDILRGALNRIEQLEKVCLSEMTKEAQALGLYGSVE